MNDRISYLYKRYCDNRCTLAEWEELMELLAQGEHDEQLAALLDETWNQQEALDGMPAGRLEHVLARLVRHGGLKKPFRLKNYAWLAAALCVLFVGIYYLQLEWFAPAADKHVDYVQVQDVLPGDNKASLILDDGRAFDLEKLKGNEVVQLNGVRVRKKEHGWIVFEVDAHTAGKSMLKAIRSTVQTPRGGEYKVGLPDGSVVLLNAFSSISFPSFFSGDERRIDLKGEAFFEVRSKDKMGKLQRPFMVHTAHQDIQVLGTSFNVQAYPDRQQYNTTLLSGAVKVTAGSDKNTLSGQVLRPGQQAAVSGGQLQIRSVDLEEVTAWKEGYFLFNNEPLERIMEQVARWYDVDILYEGNAEKLQFFGIYARNKSLKSLLLNLEQTGKIRFEMLRHQHENKERRVIVRVSRT